MDPQRGVCVFRRCDKPCLLAYRLLYDRYLSLIYYEGVASLHIVTFSELLDFVPIVSIRLRVSLPMGDTLDETTAVWLRALTDFLRAVA